MNFQKKVKLLKALEWAIKMTNIIKNNSKGYNYSYASLSDIAEQGIEIPKMKTISENGKEYVAYWDNDLNEWIRGAEVVLPDSKGMNKAQIYGSALTYARRYTTHLAMRLAPTDDKTIEDIDENGELKEKKPASKKQIEYILSLYKSIEQRTNICQHFGIENIDELTSEQASEVIERTKKWNQ